MQSELVLAVHRFGKWRYSVRPALLRKPLSALYRMLFKAIQIVTGAELPCETEIGRNFTIDWTNGIIVSGYAKFGDNCRLQDGVVIGLRRVEEKLAPMIGNDVEIRTGAKLLGPIKIGNGVLIEPNAVVIQDVPDNCIAEGVPATFRRKP